MRNAMAIVLLALCLILAAVILLPRGNRISRSVSVQPVALSHVVGQLTEARAQGQVSVLYLYASWCDACEASMPNLNRVARRYSDEGVRFVIVSVDEDPEALEQMLRMTGAAFEPLCTPAAPPEKLRAAVAGLGGTYPEVIPYGVVFDGTGKPYREWTGWRSWAAWEGTMEELL